MRKGSGNPCGGEQCAASGCARHHLWVCTNSCSLALLCCPEVLPEAVPGLTERKALLSLQLSWPPAVFAGPSSRFAGAMSAVDALPLSASSDIDVNLYLRGLAEDREAWALLKDQEVMGRCMNAAVRHCPQACQGIGLPARRCCACRHCHPRGLSTWLCLGSDTLQPCSCLQAATFMGSSMT